MAKVLVVISEINYQDLEYNDTKESIEKGGHEVITASTKEEAHGKLGGKTKVDILMDDVKEEDYDAIAFIGGPGSTQYFNDQKALSLAKEFLNAGKITSAVCAAPSILAYAGILKGKTATSHDTQGGVLAEQGANYTGQLIEKDGLIITGNGPAAAKQFGEVIAKSL